MDNPTKDKPKLTRQQQKALHVFLAMKAQQCRDAGITAQMAFNKTIELEMSDEMMKEIWRQVQKALYGKKSTTQLSKQGEIDEIAEHLNRFFAGNDFNLPGIDFPSEEHKSELIQGMELAKKIDYPEEDLTPTF